MKYLHLLAAMVAIYASILLARTEGLIKLKFFVWSLNSFNKIDVWIVHNLFLLFFYGGLLLLLKGLSEGWMKSIEIFGKNVKINDQNRKIVVLGFWTNCAGLIASLGLMLMPNHDLSLSHIDFGIAFVVVILASCLSAIWSRRKISAISGQRE
ncbi:MAG: hypothetical protein ACQKBY_07670 [Verrucomicrobiales bacterium]